MYCTLIYISLVSCPPGFLCFLSVIPAYIFQEVAIQGTVGRVFISFFFLILALTLLKEREISSCKTLLVST